MARMPNKRNYYVNALAIWPGGRVKLTLENLAEWCARLNAGA